MTDITMTRADRLQAVADRTDSAMVQAGSLTGAVRLAQLAACEDGGPMELLLREALADAVKLNDRLTMIAQFAASDARRHFSEI